MIIRRIFDYKGGPLLAIGFVLLFFLESRKVLRKRQSSRTMRVITNSIVSIPAFVLLRFVFLPLMIKLTVFNKKYRLGLVNQFNAPALPKSLVEFLVLDYGNYLWHVLNHKIPVLWRFHLVHHTDTDLDVTTAIRFHFGELIGSVLFRGLFVFFSGASAFHVLVYEILFEGATQFHHSNWKLPHQIEKSLNKIIVTPRMHGIHHSIIKSEMDSNYSVIFSFWDQIHKTLKLDIEQDKLIIGVPFYTESKELTILNLLKMPFTKIKHGNTILKNA